MPFYPELRITPEDDSKLRIKKRRTAENLKHLKIALSKHFSTSKGEQCNDPSSGKTIKLATWNIRKFGGIKPGGRDFEAMYYIAEIIAGFDIVAIQEVLANLEGIKRLKAILGPDWDHIASDVTDGDPGNGERMVFLYNRSQVQFTNIAGELTLKEGAKIRAAFGERIKLENGIELKLGRKDKKVYDAKLKTDSKGNTKLKSDLSIPLKDSTLQLPKGTSLVLTKNAIVESPEPGKIKLPSLVSGKNARLKLPENSFDDSLRQFARTPYIISFQAGWLKLNLCTVHIYYGAASGDKLMQRKSEIEQLTKALANKAEKEFILDDKTFLGVLGDFNIVGHDHPTMKALESNGFEINEKLKTIPGSNVERDKFYDQIAFWKPSRNLGYASLDIQAGNIFDFFEHIYTVEDKAIYEEEYEQEKKKKLTDKKFKDWRTYKMSDHLPMWVELRTDFGEAYLDAILSNQRKVRSIPPDKI